MTDYEVKINSGTAESPARFRTHPIGAIERVIYISDVSTLELKSDLDCEAVLVGVDGTTLSNETGTLKFFAPYKVRFSDKPQIIFDPRIVWATDGSRQVNRGSGLVVQNCSSTRVGNGTKGADVREDGPQGEPTNLVLYTDMQIANSSGNLLDRASEYGGGATANNLTPSGGPVPAVGKFGAAQQFDGVDDTFSTADQAELDVNTFTMACWVNVDVITGIRPMALKNTAYGMQFNGTTLEILIWDNVGPTLITYTRTSFLSSGDIGNWVHVAVTYDGANVRAYRNGTEVGTADARTATTNNSASSFGLGNFDTNWFDGRIDEFGLWSSGLSAAAIARVAGDSKGIIRQAWNFLGTNTTAGAISITDHYELNTPTASFCAWIRPDSLSQNRPIIEHMNSGATQGFTFQVLSTGALQLTTGSQAGYNRIIASTAGDIVINTWAHVAFTYDGTTARLFKDGVVVKTQTFNEYLPIASSPQFSTISYIGFSDFLEVDKAFSGRIDELFWFGEVLQPSEVIAFFNLSDSPSPSTAWGLLLSETGTINEDSADSHGPSKLDTESLRQWGFISQVSRPRNYWPMFIQGSTGWAAFASTGSPSAGKNYIIQNHAPGFTLQTTTTNLKEEYSFRFNSMNPLAIQDNGGDSPINTTIGRRGNVGRIKKIGLSPRKITFRVRINIQQPGGLSQLRRIHELATTSYKESDIFNIYTDKHILLGFQLTDYDETEVRNARWKLVDVEIEFTKRVL